MYRLKSIISFFVASLMVLSRLDFAIGQLVPGDNIECFVERDFCIVFGFIRFKGSPLLVEVKRAGTVVGSTEVIVSGEEVAFEINHPGTACWGDSVSTRTLQVTPDIIPGDVVSVRLPSSTVNLFSYTIRDGRVETTTFVPPTDTTQAQVILTGIIDPDAVAAGNVNVEIVNPSVRDMDPAIGRAINFPLIPVVGADFSAKLEVVGNTFTATASFANTAVAEVFATQGGEGVLMWDTDAGDVRLGLTISEKGEVGGPSSGSCPAGPASAAIPPPEVFLVHGKTLVWTPAVNTPGGLSIDRITEYEITILKTNSLIYGYRVPATLSRWEASDFTIEEGDKVSIRSVSAGNRLSIAREVFVPVLPTASSPNNALALYQASTPAVAFIVNTAAGATTYTTDVPLTEASSVELVSSTEHQLLYLVGSSPDLIDSQSGAIAASALVYAGPIDIIANTVIQIVAVDINGNKQSAVLTGTFKKEVPPLPLGPASATLTNIQNGGGVKVTFPLSASPFGDIKLYSVLAYDVNDNTKAPIEQQVPQPPSASVSTLSTTFSSLKVGVTYTFTVRAQNAAQVWSLPTTATGTFTQLKPYDAILVARATWIRTEIRISGTTLVPTVGGAAARVTVYFANADGSKGAAVRSGAVTALVTRNPLAVIQGSFDMRIRNVGNKPANTGFIIESTAGGSTFFNM